LHIDALIAMSGAHYDGVCKLASSPDGFLTLWSRRLKMHEEWDEKAYGPLHSAFSAQASFAELDTLLKILEMVTVSATAAIITHVAAVACRALTRDLSGAAIIANLKYLEWQTVYNGEPIG
jgi:hypothetical protein